MAYQKNVIQPVRVGGDSQALQLSRALKEVASGIDRFGKGFKKEYDEEQKAEAEKAFSGFSHPAVITVAL